MRQQIFLIGFMGTGKTSLGKKLAKKMNLPFFDIDKEISDKFNCSIADFFEKYGEEEFRKEEHKQLKEIISNQPKAIISVGGGLPCFHDNMTMMNASGITIYLNRPVNELFQRLKNSKQPRPLLIGKNDQELLRFIQEKLQEREHFYKQAKLEINRDESRVESIIQKLQEFEGFTI